MKKNKENKHEKPREFSKVLLIQESILIWVHTIALIVLAFICILSGYFGELPWLSAMVAMPWGAYAVSQHAYYRKAEKENTKNGIIYETAILDYFPNENQVQEYLNNNNSTPVG